MRPTDEKTTTIKAPSKASNFVSGADLVPNLGSHAAGALQSYLFWVGVLPTCPVEGVALGGVMWPKINENLVTDPMRTNQKRRIPVIGSIVALDRFAFQRIRERLPRTVIRIHDLQEGQREEPGTGLNMGDVHLRPRRGQLITIPTDEEIAAAQANGRSVRRYTPRENDVPAARFLFAQLCADQKNGSRTDSYPEPLEVTGLTWPEN